MFSEVTVSPLRVDSARRAHAFPRGEGGPALAGSEEEWRYLTNGMQENRNGITAKTQPLNQLHGLSQHFAVPLQSPKSVPKSRFWRQLPPGGSVFAPLRGARRPTAAAHSSLAKQSFTTLSTRIDYFWNKSVERYRSPVSGRRTTMVLPAFSGFRASSRAAWSAAPEEMPTRMPSALPRARAAA